jgi:hypothetical protein
MNGPMVDQAALRHCGLDLQSDERLLPSFGDWLKSNRFGPPHLLPRPPLHPPPGMKRREPDLTSFLRLPEVSGRVELCALLGEALTLQLEPPTTAVLGTARRRKRQSREHAWPSCSVTGTRSGQRCGEHLFDDLPTVGSRLSAQADNATCPDSSGGRSARSRLAPSLSAPAV